jgi:hypothetical protein
MNDFKTIMMKKHIDMKRILSDLKIGTIRLRFVLPVLFILLFGEGMMAQEGGDEIFVWKGNENLQADFIVEDGDELIIKPRTIVEFNSWKLVIKTGGKLTADGGIPSPINAPIQLTSSDKNGWGGIIFTSNDTESIIRNCHISNISPIIDNSNQLSVNTGAIQVEQTTLVTIEDSEFFSNKGGIVTSVLSKSIIRNCRFYNNEIGGDLKGLIYIDQSDADIVSSHFHDNTVNNDGVVAFTNESNVFILDNEFTSTNYLAPTVLFSKHVISTKYGESQANNQGVIMNNIFENNKYIDVHLLSFSFVFLINNVFIADQQDNTESNGLISYDSYVKIDNCEFQYYDGGAVDLNSTTASVFNCDFRDNQRTTNNKGGGAIRIRGDFIENNPQEFVIENNIFSNNSASMGGAIYTDFSDAPDITYLKVERNQFTNNSALNGDGGALFVDGKTELLLRRNYFEQNNAIQNSGALHIKNIENVILSENLFNDNTANANAGACTFSDIQNMSINHNQFKSCIAGANGGAGFISMVDAIEVSENTFNACEAMIDGGGMFINELESISIYKNRFYNNHSLENGGAIYLINSNLDASNNIFLMNISEKGGGGIYAIDNEPEFGHTFSLYKNEFSINSSNESGGAMVCLSENHLEPNLSASLSLINNQFLFNSSASSGNASIGGALFVKQSHLNLNNNKISHNQASNGGGVYFDGLYNSTILNNNFYKNIAFSNGGGGYFVNFENIDISVTDNVFTKCEFNTFGGGLFIENCNDLELFRTRISQCFTSAPAPSSIGGGVYIKSSSVNFYNSIFNDNDAGPASGSVAINNPSGQNFINFTNCDVVGNYNSGGVYIYQTSFNTITFNNTIFFGNGNAIPTTFITPGANNMVATTNYCWFNQGDPSNYLSVGFINALESSVPGLESTWNNFNLIPSGPDESICIDSGNPEVIYNDNFDPSTSQVLPPSLGNVTNDIGATGGPETPVGFSNNLLIVDQVSSSNPLFTVTILSNKPLRKTIRIEDSSTNVSDTSFYYWFFGDGNDSIIQKSNLKTFNYSYDPDISINPVVTLIIKTGTDVAYSSVTVNFTSVEVNDAAPIKNLTSAEFEIIPHKQMDGLTIFPNPSSGEFYIKHNFKLNSQVSVIIHSHMGIEVFKKRVSGLKENLIPIGIQGLKPGLYFVTIEHVGELFTKKILISQ